MRDGFIQIDARDTVAVALMDHQKGAEVTVSGNSYILRDDIPFGHKMALKDFDRDEPVLKYGEPIGHATQPISKGEWVHGHNLATNLNGLLEYRYEPSEKISAGTEQRQATFSGYRRADGRVGTRNEIWIIPTVSCVNTTVNKIAQAAQQKFGGLCDGVFALPHNAGCSQLGDDHKTTQRILASIIRHPNAGGVLLVSLGCENNDLQNFLPVLGDYDQSRIKTMVTQDIDGDEVETGLRLVEEIAAVVSGDTRTEVPVTELKIAFKCGGSDAFSGITANPLCGRIADRVVELGGSGILTEVPEMFGAEYLLMNRADSEETFHKMVELINGFKQYYMGYDQPIYENPSPGNKRGGITTLEEKSLGCIQKGGRAAVTDTLGYGQPCVKPGLNLMTGPGNDSVSITNLLASGAQILLFTTGRGNPLATAIPTIKIASNDRLTQRKNNWIDFNAGMVLSGGSFSEAADALWEQVIDVASGRKRTQNEIHNYREIMIFKNGVLL